jgi:hypothetical protein
VTADVRDLLPLYALGMLAPDEARAVERAVDADPTMAAELAAFEVAAADLVVGLEPVAPAAAVRDRLLASAGGGRFDRFAARLAGMFDVGVARARELLGLIEDPGRWEAAFPGAGLLHFEGGPACAGADNGFVRLEAGAPFPWHRHEGDETVLVLQGSIVDGDGKVTAVGEEDRRRAGTEHDFSAGPDEDLIFAARVFGVRWDVEKPS